MEHIATTRDLEAVIGSRPLPAMLKSIAALDIHCVSILNVSPIGIVGYVGEDGAARATVVGGAPGFVAVAEPTKVRLPVPADLAVAEGSSVSSVFLVPGLGETLRINGRAAASDDRGLLVTVEEAFAHCAKCVIRSKLWSDERTEGRAAVAAVDEAPPSGTGALGQPGMTEFLDRSSFAVITSWDATGAADASPKGDPAGFIRVVDAATIAIPDRPGNRRTDTFHNVVEQPSVAVLALVPGETRALEISGAASISTERGLLEPMAVGGRLPKAALKIAVDRAWIREVSALELAALWDPARHVPQADLPDMSRVWVDHLRQNKQRGVAAAAVRSMASETLLGAALDRDYKNNLY